MCLPALIFFPVGTPVSKLFEHVILTNRTEENGGIDGATTADEAGSAEYRAQMQAAADMWEMDEIHGFLQVGFPLMAAVCSTLRTHTSVHTHTFLVDY